MRFWSFVFLAAFSLNCSSEDTGAERASGIGGNESGSSTTGRGGTSAGAGSGGTATGSGGVATSTGGGSVTTGGGSVATGGAAGFSGGGGSTGSGGAAKDASVETGPPPDPGPLSGGGAGCNDADPVHQGSATYYVVGASSLPHCSYDLGTMPQPPYWVAMNFQRYAKSSDCGACLDVTGPSGTKRYTVIDECPNDPVRDARCQSREHLDLSQEGLSAIGGVGRIDMLTWKYVPCDIGSAKVEVFTQPSSNTFYATIGLRKHRYRIQKVELVTGSTRIALERRPDNYFVIDSTTPAGSVGMALGPLRIRITDVYNHWIENKITLQKGQSVSMGLQFPACPAGGDAGP